jgi:hypothetical protein
MLGTTVCLLDHSGQRTGRQAQWAMLHHGDSGALAGVWCCHWQLLLVCQQLVPYHAIAEVGWHEHCNPLIDVCNCVWSAVWMVWCLRSALLHAAGCSTVAVLLLR